ncbi:MAG: aquaporin [Solirubrobacterales bacterium]|nr:aquaporin [Solirubrobacterales bacterium]
MAVFIAGPISGGAATGPISGGAANLARALGPEIVALKFTDVWA